MPLIAAALLVASVQAQVDVDRVDFLAEDSGVWLNHELPRVGVAPSVVAARFAEQVQIVWSLPLSGLTFGTSISSQSLAYEFGSSKRAHLFINAGIESHLLLPSGIFGAVAWRYGVLRLSIGAALTSTATWSNLSYRTWMLLPTVGIGIGRPKPDE